MQELQIDLTFQDFLRPLTSVEYKVLEDNILKYGIRDSIVVWKNHNTIIDGHNRYSICQKNNIDFNIVQLDFETEDDVISWMIENQDGRRNETLEMKYKKIDKYLLKYPEKPSSTVAKSLKVSIPTVIKRRNLMTLIFPEGSTVVDSRGRNIPLRKKSKDSTKKKMITSDDEKDKLIVELQQKLQDKDELISYLNDHIADLQFHNKALTIKLGRKGEEKQVNNNNNNEQEESTAVKASREALMESHRKAMKIKEEREKEKIIITPEMNSQNWREYFDRHLESNQSMYDLNSDYLSKENCMKRMDERKGII